MPFCFYFYRFCFKSASDMFLCNQTPLILAFGLTKTLSSVALHCKGALAPGQVGGQSRMCSPEDITVIGLGQVCACHMGDQCILSMRASASLVQIFMIAPKTLMQIMMMMTRTGIMSTHSMIWRMITVILIVLPSCFLIWMVYNYGTNWCVVVPSQTPRRYKYHCSKC